MRKNILMAAVLAAALLGSAVQGWAASLVASVDISNQTMTVSKYGQVLYRWNVSTARRGYVTPRGTYRPTWTTRMWYSHKYHMSPMPYAVFFRGGYAIHGTYYVKSLGMPASHGCVRLLTANAATFYTLVNQVGPSNTQIVVTD